MVPSLIGPWEQPSVLQVDGIGDILCASQGPWLNQSLLLTLVT